MFKVLRILSCATLIGVATGIFSAQAMGVSPIVLDMSTMGNKTSQLTVTNDNATPMPVEIIVSRVELNEKGEMTSTPAGDEFLIFPPQAMVSAGGSQVFRIQWVGDPQIKTSQSYTFSVNQVPLAMPEGKSGVQVVFNFACVVNVSPANGTSGINIVRAAVGKDEKGKLRPEVVVSNPGNIHAKLTDATVTLSSGSWSQTLTPEQLHQKMGVGLVQPGKTRRFLLPVDMPEGVTKITANIQYKPAK